MATFSNKENAFTGNNISLLGFSTNGPKDTTSTLPNSTRPLHRYSLTFFVCTCVFGAGMLMSGAGSNKIMRKYAFLRAKVFEMKARDQEIIEKKKQNIAYAKTKKEEAKALREKEEADAK